MTPPIQFKDLSISLKVLIVFRWILLFLFVVVFITGFIQGAIGI